MTELKLAKIEHDLEDEQGRTVKIVLTGDYGLSFELMVEPKADGSLDGDLHVVTSGGERNHGSRPFYIHSDGTDNPLGTAQRFADQAWTVMDQEYHELIFACNQTRDRVTAQKLIRELALRKQEVLGDIVDAFVKVPDAKWTGWKRGFVLRRCASAGLRVTADDLEVPQLDLNKLYDVAAKAMQGGVKTFNEFEAKLRTALGANYPTFEKALGGRAGLHPIWTAVVEHDADDLQNSLEDLRISSRLPSAKAETKKGPRKVPLEDPHAELRLQPDLEAMTRDPKALHHNVELMLQYPEFCNIQGTSDEDKAKHIVDHMVDNLVWLYNQWKSTLQSRSKAWYVGGNRIVHRWAKRFQCEPQAVAAVLSSLSPQQHWFQNVTLGERVISAMTEHYEQPWDDAMTQVILTRSWGGKGSDTEGDALEEAPEEELLDNEEVDPEVEETEGTVPSSAPKVVQFRPVDINYDSTTKLKAYRILGNLQGKSLKDLEGPRPMDTYLQAVWIRAYDEAHLPNGCRNVTPEGEFGDWYRTDKGVPVKNRWNSFNEIMKALRVFKDPSLRNISDNAGANHKVRSFYNNLIAPLSDQGDVTIDTHAVAAALLRPLSSSSIEVLHNFGSGKAAKEAKPYVAAHLNPETGRKVKEQLAAPAQPKISGPVKSSITGNTGLYGFYATAYREAAKQVGIQPREMQSITWEAVRGLFKPAQKRDKNFVAQVENQWRNFSNGTASKDTTRNHIRALAGGLKPGDDAEAYAAAHANAIEAPSWAVSHPRDAEGSGDSSYAGGLHGNLEPGQESQVPNASGGGAGVAAAAAPGLGGRGGRRGGRGGRVAKLLQPRTYAMPLKDAIKEHVELVDFLEHPTVQEDRKELKDQGNELKEMEQAATKHSKLLQPRHR